MFASAILEKSWTENKFLEKPPNISYREPINSFGKSMNKFFDESQNLLKKSTLKTQIDETVVL